MSMNKFVRFLIVSSVILALIIFSRTNNLGSTVGGKALSTFKIQPAAVKSSDNPILQHNLVLLEFFSGL